MGRRGRGDNDDDRNLIPADDPFAAPPPAGGEPEGGEGEGEGKPKRQLFGRRRGGEQGEDPFTEPPRLEDISTTDPWQRTTAPPQGRRSRPLITPWSAEDDEEIDPPAPPPRAQPPRQRRQRQAPPQPGAEDPTPAPIPPPPDVEDMAVPPPPPRTRQRPPAEGQRPPAAAAADQPPPARRRPAQPPPAGQPSAGQQAGAQAGQRPPQQRQPAGQRAPGPPAAAPPPPPPPRQPEPLRRLPDPNEVELEFVFATSAPAQTMKLSRSTSVKKETIDVMAPLDPPQAERRISRSTAILLAALVLIILGVVAYALFFSGGDDPEPTIAPLPSAAPSATATVAPSPTQAAVTVSEECLNAFSFAAANPQPESNVTRTADLCTTTEEWLAAAAQQPAAIGASSAAEVGNDDIQRICASAAQSAMCQDAAQKGLLSTSPSPAASAGASPGGNATGTATQGEGTAPPGTAKP